MLIILTTLLKLVFVFSQDMQIYPNIEFKGITFVGDKYCPEVPFTSKEAELSMLKLSQTGANWVSVVVTEYQDYRNSTTIYPIYSDFPVKKYYTYKTETIEGITNIINYAKSLGMKILFKPQIDLSETGNVTVLWRGDIGEGMDSNDVDQWFQSYEEMIVKYADLAEKLNVELFSVSCELVKMSKYESHWRKVVASIRSVFSGELTDAANHGIEVFNKTWWDAVDYIGVDAYFLGIDYTEYKSYLQGNKSQNFYQPFINQLQNLSEKFKKEVIVTEVGFCSGNCDRNSTSTINQQVDFAKIYLDFYEIFAKQEFIKGFFWWAWNSDPYYGGLEDVCLSPQFKFTENVLRYIYQSENLEINYIPEGKPKCICTH